MQREEPYLVLTSWESRRDMGVPQGAQRQVLHGCRQLVSRDVGLSPATSATLVLSCHHLVGNSKETAGDKPEEGGIPSVEVKFVDIWRNTCGEGGLLGRS